MKSRLGLALAVSTIVASGAFFSVSASAQQQALSPKQEQKAAPPNAMQKPDFAAKKVFRAQALAKLSQMSPQDRAAFLDARIAAVKAGLELTADQAKLWAPLEQTMRDGVGKAIEMHQKFAGKRPADPMQRLTRLSKIASTRADFLRRFVDAAKPLYASLTADQKRRLPMLMHAVGGPVPGWRMHGAMGRGMMHGRMRARMMARRGMMDERMRQMMRNCMQHAMRDRTGEHMRDRMRGGMREGWRERRSDRDGGWRRGDAAPRNNDETGD